MSTTDVVARLQVRDRPAFSRELQGAQGDVSGLGNAAEGAGSKGAGAMGALKVGVLAVGAAAVAIGTQLFRIGAEFQEASNTIRVGTGATGEALAALNESAMNIATTVPASFGDAATAVADLNTRLGLTGEPLEAISGQMLELSRITGTDVAANIADMSRLFGDWGVEAEAIPGTMDAIFRAAQATGIEIGQLSNQMVAYGAPMRQLGFTFEEGAALLANFEQQGVNAELVMGSMRQALGRMARDGEPAVETFQRVTEEIANAGSASEANALALELFGARAGPDMAAAIREGRFEVADLMDTIANGSETIMAAGEDTRGFSEQWTLFKNQLMRFVQPAATALFNAISRGMEWVAEQAPRVLARMQPFFDGVQEAWPRIQEAIVTAWGYIEPVISFFGDLLAWQWRNIYMPVAQFVIDYMWPAIATAISVAWDIARPIVTSMGETLTFLWDNVLTPLWNFWVDRMWPMIQRSVEDAWNVLSGIFNTIATVLGAAQTTWRNFRDTVTGVWQAIQDKASEVWEWVQRNVIDPMSAAFDRVGNAMSALNPFGGGTAAETAAPSTGLPPSATRAVASFAAVRPSVTQVRNTTSSVGGDTHHHWSITAVDAPSFEQLISRNAAVVTQVVDRTHRRQTVTA